MMRARQVDKPWVLGAQGLMVLGLEPADSGAAAAAPLRMRLRGAGRGGADGPEADGAGLLGALLNGLVGVLSEPLRCGALAKCRMLH